MHHHIFRLLLRDRLHLAPIGKNPQRILDMGTGTGIWAIEMAEYATGNMPLNRSALLIIEVYILPQKLLGLILAQFSPTGILPAPNGL